MTAETAPPVRLGHRSGFVAAAFALAVAIPGTTLPTPRYGLYRQQFGFSELMITVIFATYAAGVIASLCLFGRLSDHIGRRVLLPGLVLSALRLTFWVDLALLVPAAIGIWAMSEPIVSTSQAQPRPEALTVPREMRPTFIEAALASFAVLGLLTAVTPDFLGQELGVTTDRGHGCAGPRLGCLLAGVARARGRDRRVWPRTELPRRTDAGERTFTGRPARRGRLELLRRQPADR
jgi:MFS family permease